jgi:hypothetical protein
LLALWESHAAKVFALFSLEGTIFCFTTKLWGVGVICNVLSLVVEGYYIYTENVMEKGTISYRVITLDST